jgi:4-hydroxy-tetrahydrodipicolinate synthase
MLFPMNGLFAALATPIDAGGRIDLATCDRLVEFLLAAGVDGVVAGGATGEYPHFQMRERAELVRRAAERLPRNRRLVAGIGGASMRRVVKLGRMAIDAGAESLLLPAPFFFRYEQDDLRAYFAHVSREVNAPCLLYDLPDFTNPILPPTVFSLLREEPHIVGIKDSSGRAENIETFAAERQKDPWTLLVGDDRLMARGVKAGWNGGISGVAGFCPELMVRLYRSVVRGQTTEAGRLEALVHELIERISVFPTPWGVRIGLAARGMETGPLPLPVTPRRRQQIEEFHAWFQPWLQTI